MPDSAVLQVLIGLALVFAVFSVAVSRANETVLGFLNYRGRQLEDELRRLTGGYVPRDPATPSPAAAVPTPAAARRQAQAAGDPAPAASTGTAARDLTAEMFDGPLRGLRTSGRPSVPAVATMKPATTWWQRIRRARQLRMPTYLPSTAFARAVLDLVEPAPRALLTRVSPAEMSGIFDPSVTEDQRAAYAEAYRAAYEGLTPRTARLLDTAMPAECERGRAVTAAMVALLAGSGGQADGRPGGAGPTATAADEVVASAYAAGGTAGPAGGTAAGLSTEGTVLLPLGTQIALLPDSALKTALIGIAARAGADRDKLLAELAQWYDASMDRLSGWYKRRVGRFLVGYALVLTVAFNLDAISLTRTLWQDSAVRTAAVATAESRTSQTGSSGGEDVVDAVRDTGALQIPFGWTGSAAASDPRAVPKDAGEWALKVLGWLISVAALAAGAPFWFDLLGRLVNMRSTGPKPKPAGS
jgi:hypothetical protein